MPRTNEPREPQLTDAQERKNAQVQRTFEPLLDVDEAAQLLRMHPRTVRNRARKGMIPAIQVGKRWRFRVSMLNEWLERAAG